MITIDVKIGSIILTGKFKNKRTVVKNISTDDHGMPLINGKKCCTFRIAKEQKMESKIPKLKELIQTNDKKMDSPFPAKYHEFLEDSGIDYPGSNKHKVMREILKSIAVNKGMDAAIEYIVKLYPNLDKKIEELRIALKADRITSPLQFIDKGEK